MEKPNNYRKIILPYLFFITACLTCTFWTACVTGWFAYLKLEMYFFLQLCHYIYIYLHHYTISYNYITITGPMSLLYCRFYTGSGQTVLTHGWNLMSGPTRTHTAGSTYSWNLIMTIHSSHYTLHLMPSAHRHSASEIRIVRHTRPTLFE